MKEQDKTGGEFPFKVQKRLVLAAAEPESSKRAAMYLGALLGGLPGFHITVLSVVALPPEAFFAGPEEKKKWTEEREAEAREVVDACRHLLVQSEFEEDSVETAIVVRDCTSVAVCILEEVKKAGACTVVMGRRGVSPKEEFLFGSTSSRVVHKSHNCAVWIVE